MANVTETPSYESGIYRIETTDPIIGGENGISNIQAKQLANRTGYLKQRADQVDAAKGSYGNLAERMAAVEGMAVAVGPEMQNATVGAVKMALDLAAQSVQGVSSLRGVWQQEISFLFVNRGVVHGCSVTKSDSASRNISISSGRCFSLGEIWPVGEGVNAASVPSNSGSGSIAVYAYLYPSGGYSYSLAVTVPGEEVPWGGIPIYMITVPAGNTDVTDPYLSNVTLTDIRRIEPNFPVLLETPQTWICPLTALRDADFRVDFDVVSYTGGHCDRNSIVTYSRAPNGIIVRLDSASDVVYVLARVSKLNN